MKVVERTGCRQVGGNGSRKERQRSVNWSGLFLILFLNNPLYSQEPSHA